MCIMAQLQLFLPNLSLLMILLVFGISYLDSQKSVNYSQLMIALKYSKSCSFGGIKQMFCNVYTFVQYNQ